MKRLPGIGIGLVLVVQATVLAPLSAQPVGFGGQALAIPVSGTPAPPAAQHAPTSHMRLFNASLVLASLAHLPLDGETSVTASAADRPALGYVAPAAAATLANVDPFFAVSLGRLGSSGMHIPRTGASVLVSPTAAQPAPLLTSQVATQSMSHWRLGSRFLPTTAGAPVINLPPSGTAGGGSHAAGGTSGLGLGTVAVSGLSTPFAGVPEPSTYLLCGVVLVLGGCWYARRRGKKPPTSTEAVDLRTLALGETGESLSSIASATR